MITKKISLLAGLVFLTVFQSAYAKDIRSDDMIKSDIAERIAKNETLKNTNIKINVKDRLAVLTGQVRLYEKKLVASRIAWSTPDVFEIDNEIRVIPKLPLADKAIERKVREIIKKYPIFNGLNAGIKVKDGVVSIDGSFAQISDPTFLRHKVAEVEGVIYIDIKATFFSMKQQLNLKEKSS